MRKLFLTFLVFCSVIFVSAESLLPFSNYLNGVICNNDNYCTGNENETNCPNDCPAITSVNSNNAAGNNQPISDYGAQQNVQNKNIRIKKIEKSQEMPSNKLAYASVFVFIFVIILSALVLWLHKNGFFQESVRGRLEQIKGEKTSQQKVNSFGLPMKPSRKLFRRK